MPVAPNQIAAAGYAIGLLAYLAFSAQLYLRAPHSGRARLLLAAAAATAIWEVAGLVFALYPTANAWLLHQLTDAMRIGAWALFLAALLPAAPAVGRKRGLPAVPHALLALLSAGTLALAAVFAYSRSLPNAAFAGDAAGVMFTAWMCAAILGLVVCEKLFRGAPDDRRWAIKPLCLGVAAVSGFDLFMFSDAMLLHQLDHEVWSVRGLVHAATIPLVMLASARNRDWTIDIGVSRSVVFGSFALLLCGLYLLAVAGAGYLVRLYGGDWGRAIQVAFLFAAILLLALLFSSGSVRARLRVFVSKHFFSYRYDYREAWHRLTARLADDGAPLQLTERTVSALADLVESPAGALWLAADHGPLRPAARWNMPELQQEVAPDSSLAVFLQRTGWIVNVEEALRAPQRYPGLGLPGWLAQAPQAWLIVPLLFGETLIGFVLLARPRAALEVNWEMRDLLKTAARQAAAFLGQLQAAQALLEARQFEAFNRMSAFVVHDLKNLVAQLELVLRNAQRHAANPEFQKDMLSTVAHVAERMSRLLLQLRSGATPVEKPGVVDLNQLAQRLGARYLAQRRTLALEIEPGLRAVGHPERLERVVGHLVQNAIDATDADGHIAVRGYRDGQQAVVEVRDDGRGMTPAFVREHLFKAFHSTKPSGMGIGAYESQQYVTELGGRICVESAENAGTCVRVHLPAPAGDAAGLAAGAQRAAA
jgi:putative PEP-CTERM system histidine kinase